LSFFRLKGGPAARAGRRKIRPSERWIPDAAEWAAGDRLPRKGGQIGGIPLQGKRPDADRLCAPRAILN